MKFSNKGFVSKCDQIRIFLRIWSHLLKKSLMKNFIFCAVMIVWNDSHFGLNLLYLSRKMSKSQIEIEVFQHQI